MTKLLEIKEWLKVFYGKFDVYLQAVWKFAQAVLVMTALNQNVGFMNSLKSPVVVILIGLICSVLPYGGMALIFGAVILAHFYALSLELAGITALLLVMMYLFFLRFENKSTFALILTPLLFWMRIPYLAPILVGLTGGLIGILPVGCGVMVYYIIAYARSMAPSLSSSTVDNLMETIRMIADGLMGNKEMMVVVAAFAATVIIVHLIKSLSIDYAWVIAIGVGAVADILILIAGDFMLDTDIPIAGMILGSVVSVFFSFVIQFFLFTVDYSRTEHVQFEDEEYVYYVKAVPKMRVTTPEVNVKRINAQKTQKPRETEEPLGRRTEMSQVTRSSVSGAAAGVRSGRTEGTAMRSGSTAGQDGFSGRIGTVSGMGAAGRNGATTGTRTTAGTGAAAGTRTTVGTGTMAGKRTTMGTGTGTTTGTRTTVGTRTAAGTRTTAGTGAAAGTRTTAAVREVSATRNASSVRNTSSAVSRPGTRTTHTTQHKE